MTVQSIIEFAIGLILLVLIHELGHFGMARLCKIGVDEFGIGIPPRMLTLFEAGGTKFSLNWLPFGGFVRLKGENDPNVPGGFASANPWARIAVLLAGPFANLFAAVVMMIIITGIIGVPDKILIEDVVPNSPAEQAGFVPGDVILSANGREVHQSDELHDIIYSNLCQPITVAYLRGEEVTSVVIIPRVNPPEGEGAVGISMSNPYRPISPFRAIPLGISATYDQINHLAQFFGQLVSGKVSLAQARPVGIVGMTHCVS